MGNPDRFTSLEHLTAGGIDCVALARAIGNRPQLAEQLICALIAEVRQSIPVLERALRCNDQQTIREVAHKLAGGAAYCGALRLRDTCLALERCITQKHADVDARCADLRAAAAQLLALDSPRQN